MSEISTTRLASVASVMRDSFEREPLIWSLTAALVLFMIWGSVFDLDVASYAQGQVIPAGQIKKVQHLEGGIVREIHVVEGQRVNAGDVIADLEDVTPDADVGDLRGRMASGELKELRITALLGNRSRLDIPADLANANPSQARDAISAFESYRQHYTAMVQSFESKIAQRREEIEETRERYEGLVSRSKFIADQVKISSKMLEQKLTNDYEHLQLLKEQAQIDADRDTTFASQRRTQKAFEEAIAELEAYRHEESVNLRKELQEISTELASLKERLRKPSDSQDRTVVRAPVAGTIMTLFVKSKGAVVAPGGTLATLVPDGESLLIEAKLPISEVGYVTDGAPARLTIAAGGSGFTSIKAKVVYVSADTIADEKTGASYYVVRLRPEELFFHRKEVLYPLRPGVQVTAAIITGQRSVWGLLLSPFLGDAVQPLTER